MFVAVSCDLASDDHRRAVYGLLRQYGFVRVLGSLYECTTLTTAYLARLKRDLDKVTDSYDKLRIYQYPMDQTLVITSLEEKRWRKLKVKA